MPVLFNDLTKDTLLNAAKTEGIISDAKVTRAVNHLNSFENDFNLLPDLGLAKSIYPYDFYVSTISDMKIAIYKLEDTTDIIRNIIVGNSCYLYLRYDAWEKKYDAYISKDVGFSNNSVRIKLKNCVISKYIKVLEKNTEAMQIVKCGKF